MSSMVRIAIVLLCAYAGFALGAAQFEELPESSSSVVQMSPARKTMSTRLASIQIDEEHSRAICAEIGDRLRIALGVPPPIPPDLARLIARLGELEHHDLPSIVPSVEEISPTLHLPLASGDLALLEE